MVALGGNGVTGSGMVPLTGSGGTEWKRWLHVGMVALGREWWQWMGMVSLGREWWPWVGMVAVDGDGGTGLGMVAVDGNGDSMWEW